MSRRNLITVVAVVLFSIGGVKAGTIWEEKPFNAWTDAELNSLLTGSPWAGSGSMSRIKPDGTVSKTRDTVIISWTSALPMRQAVAREQIGFNGPITKQVETFLTTPLDTFILAVKITGTADARLLAARAGTAQTSTLLEPRDKNPFVALRGEGHIIDADGKLVTGRAASAASVATPGQTAAGGSLLVFAFPRNPITARDREVEFTSRLGEFIIRRIFHVNDMIYNGKLEL